MCRLACNVCGVTTVNGSSVGWSSCCRLSRRRPLSVISPDRPSTAGVPAFLLILHVFCLDYHQPICASVCVGRKRQFTTSHHIFLLPRSTAVFLRTATRYHTDYHRWASALQPLAWVNIQYHQHSYTRLRPQFPRLWKLAWYRSRNQ